MGLLEKTAVTKSRTSYGFVKCLKLSSGGYLLSEIQKIFRVYDWVIFKYPFITNKLPENIDKLFNLLPLYLFKIILQFQK
jgi:hypothetical protein